MKFIRLNSCGIDMVLAGLTPLRAQSNGEARTPKA